MDNIETCHCKGEELSFACRCCKTPVSLMITQLLDNPSLCCSECGQGYDFSDPVLMRQLQKFINLCRQLKESEEILSNVAVGIDVGPHSVKVPFKVLLTRLNNTLRIDLGGEQLLLHFRVEPTRKEH